MANQLSDDRRRVSYAEWKDVYSTLEKIAKKERVDVADILRRATQVYLESLPDNPPPPSPRKKK